jgi:hypothetical protein
LAVAARNCGVFAAGGSGNLRLLDGIQTGIRDVELDRVITKIEVEPSYSSNYRNSAERVFLGCGADGISYVEFGTSMDSEQEISTGRGAGYMQSLLSGEYSDMHYFGRFLG